MSLFETTQMLEQLPVPRDDAHQQVVPGRSNPYSRPEFSKGFDYSKWDNIDTDDEEEEKPLSPAKREAPLPTRWAGLPQLPSFALCFSIRSRTFHDSNMKNVPGTA